MNDTAPAYAAAVALGSPKQAVGIQPGHPIHEYTAKRDMRILYLKGATAEQLRDFGVKVGYHPAVVDLWVKQAVRDTTPQRAAITLALLEYPSNNVQPPRITDAAPFADRASIFARKDTAA